jgi:hypothetical protein
MSLPFIRNKLAGHGQGAEIIDVPAPYGLLAMQIAAALQNFLISKYLESSPADSTAMPTEAWPEEIPF